MFIERIYDFDDFSCEADLIVSDGTYQLICYCFDFQKGSTTMPKIKEIDSFMCKNIMRVYTDKYLIIKKKDYYSYHLQGKVLDVEKKLICIGNIIIHLDAQIPRDINIQEFVEFDVVRLDCFIEHIS